MTINCDKREKFCTADREYTNFNCVTNKSSTTPASPYLNRMKFLGDFELPTFQSNGIK